MKSAIKFLFAACAGLAASAFAGEGSVAVYVVDESPEFAEMGGQCTLYSKDAKPGPNKHLLAIAKGEPGTTVLLVGFDRESDLLFSDFAPVMAAQNEDSEPMRYPSPDAGKKFSFEEEGSPVDLYFVVFDSNDPQLGRFNEFLGWMKDSFTSGDVEEANLHGLAMKNRISKMLRAKISTEYISEFGGDDSRKAPVSKAAVTRGASALSLERKPPPPTAGVRRGLKSLDKEWKEDSRKISSEAGNPGILLFPISQNKKD